MKKTKITAILLSAALVFGSCGTMNNTAKGTAIGGGGGAAVGAVLGGLALVLVLSLAIRWIRRQLLQLRSRVQK